MTTLITRALPAATHEARIERARQALEGLSVGDAFGECFFVRGEVLVLMLQERGLRPAPWRWTDDTAMALSIVDELSAHHEIRPDSLAERFAHRYAENRMRGYGGGAHQVLQEIYTGTPWQKASRELFEGMGSMGNGGAMRSAPVGAYFAEDLEMVVEQARRSAMPTHAHHDGQCGAIAIAVATAIAHRMRAGLAPREPQLLLDVAIAYTSRRANPRHPRVRQDHPAHGRRTHGCSCAR
ncbi:MAG: ADP-ribosylglycohydrolase family protein [Polyangiaceae bacterium]